MQILTILEPSTTDLEPTSHSTDNTGLTAALVSAAMAGANPIGVNMLKAAYAGDRTAHKALYGQFYDVLISLAKIQRWKFREKAKKELRLRALVDIAMFDIIVAIPCPECKGSKLDPIKKPCPVCRGIGKRRITGIDFAAVLGIDESTWRKTWEPRYSEFVQILQENLYDSRRYIYKRLINEG